MKRFASTRSDHRASQPLLEDPLARAQCSVGSMDDDGIRYGFTTHALIASTIPTAPAIVSTQSSATRYGRGRRCVARVIGLRGTLSASLRTDGAGGPSDAGSGGAPS